MSQQRLALNLGAEYTRHRVVYRRLTMYQFVERIIFGVVMALPLISILTSVAGVLAMAILICALIVYRQVSGMMPLLILGCGLRLVALAIPLLLTVSRTIGLEFPILNLATHFWMLNVLSALATVVFVLGLILVLKDVFTQMNMLRGIVEDYEYSEDE